MNSEDLQGSIQILTKKLKGLLEHYKELQGVLQQLQEENTQLRQTAVSSGISSVNFSNSSESGTITGKEERARVLGSSIDSYIRDIDKSIAYLEKIQ